MKTFYVTFGSNHDVGMDSWVEIEAETYEEAREIAFKTFDRRWAFIYSEEKFDKSWHPLGCCRRITK